MAVQIPYPIPDPATGEWDPFALKQNLVFLASRIDSITASNQTTIAFRSAAHPITDVTGTTTETTIFSTSLAAAYLFTTQSPQTHTLDILCQGDVLNDTGVARGFTIRVKLGGQTLIDFDLTGDLTSQASRRFWHLLGKLSATAEATQFASGNLYVTLPGAAAKDVDLIDGDSSGTVDLSVAQTLSITIENEVAGVSTRPFILHGQRI